MLVFLVASLMLFCVVVIGVFGFGGCCFVVLILCCLVVFSVVVVLLLLFGHHGFAAVVSGFCCFTHDGLGLVMMSDPGAGVVNWLGLVVYGGVLLVCLLRCDTIVLW